VGKINTKLQDRTVLITGAARRLGREFALGVARAGGNIILHHGHSSSEAKILQAEIEGLGVRAYLLQADLADPQQAAELIPRALEFGFIYGLVNNAAIFEPLTLASTDLPAWERHMAVNLTAPFLLCQAFARQVPQGEKARIVNILDWRALRPAADHFPYTISKAALAALTHALAAALAPGISVNGLALGAILPPSDGQVNANLLSSVPARRWANLEELSQALLFLLTGPSYVTGEIIHLDGGRHLI
jgi:NAD(P)-dependent dehydrogenase (short-subunit alcohol dehydrogenase family)